MDTKTRKRKSKTPGIVYRDNKPVSVILDLEDYNEMLNRLEDLEDLKFIKNLKSKSLKFRRLNDFLADYPASGTTSE
jgi:PHD/YefM family antitoxin component YafN of YafNO toxin-antitoxin module